MGATLLIARSRLRANVLATVLLVVLAGLGGGIVMASIAGIRRADASWTQLQAENPPGDAGIVILGPDGSPPPSIEDEQQDEVEAIAAMDEVAAVSRATAAVGMIDVRGGTPFPVAANVYLDDPVPALVGRPLIVDGVLPDPDAADEVAIDELLAGRLDARVGDRVTLTPYLYNELDDASDGRDVDPDGRPTDLRITGIVRQPGDLLPQRTDQLALYSDDPYLLLTPGWWEANGPDVGNYDIFMVADLAPGVDFADFEATMADRFGESVFLIPAIDEVGVPAEVKRAVDRQIDAEGRAVAAFGLAVALVALGLLVLALARQLSAEGADRADLLALGVTHRALLLVSLARSAVIALGAGILSFGVAVALSAQLPVGVGRRTLRDTGMDIDGTVLLLGSVLLMVVVVALVAVVGWRVDRRAPARRGRSSLADRLATAGASPTATVGVHLALERSSAGRPARTAITVAGVAVAVTVAATLLVASLDHLRSDPEELGQVWDASAGNFASAEGLEQGLSLLDQIEGIDAVAGEMSTNTTIDGSTVTAVAYDPLRGELAPRLQDGRPPATGEEAVLGAALARDLGVGIGDRLPVELPFADDPVDLEVVGIGPVGAMGFDTDPGRSMLVHSDLVKQDEEAGVSVLLVRFADDADRRDVIAGLREQFPLTVLVAPVPSRSVQTFSGLTVLPVALAVTVVLLALAASANGALASVRRRRRDLAVLKVLGMHRAQVRRVVHVQSMTWAVLALLVGVPAGIVLGSVGWREVARSLGLDTPVTLPAAALVLVVLAVPAILLALTWWPARQAAATAPAVTLRSE